MSKILMLVLPLVDKGLVMVVNAFNDSEKEDKLINFLSYSIVYWQDELRALAAKSETQLDDVLVEEAIQAAVALSE